MEQKELIQKLASWDISYKISIPTHLVGVGAMGTWIYTHNPVEYTPLNVMTTTLATLGAYSIPKIGPIVRGAFDMAAEAIGMTLETAILRTNSAITTIRKTLDNILH